MRQWANSSLHRELAGARAHAHAHAHGHARARVHAAELISLEGHHNKRSTGGMDDALQRLLIIDSDRRKETPATPVCTTNATPVQPDLVDGSAQGPAITNSIPAMFDRGGTQQFHHHLHRCLSPCESSSLLRLRTSGGCLGHYSPGQV